MKGLPFAQLLHVNAVQNAWQSRLRKALNPEIQRLVRLIDAYVDRFAKFGDRRDLIEAEWLRHKVAELKAEITKAEALGRD